MAFEMGSSISGLATLRGLRCRTLCSGSPKPGHVKFDAHRTLEISRRPKGLGFDIAALVFRIRFGCNIIL